MSNVPISPRMNDVEKNRVDSPLEGSPYQLGSHEDVESTLRKIKTAGSVSIAPELFESLFLSPKNRVANNLRATFGNPTPLYVNG